MDPGTPFSGLELQCSKHSSVSEENVRVRIRQAPPLDAGVLHFNIRYICRMKNSETGHWRQYPALTNPIIIPFS